MILPEWLQLNGRVATLLVSTTLQNLAATWPACLRLAGIHPARPVVMWLLLLKHLLYQFRAKCRHRFGNFLRLLLTVQSVRAKQIRLVLNDEAD